MGEIVRILVDLNVILDVLKGREPHVAESASVWRAVELKQVEGAVAGHSVTTLFYLLAKEVGSSQAQEIIQEVLKVFVVAKVDQGVIGHALSLSWKDFEDAVQMGSAEAFGADFLVTRNVRDFAGGEVRVIRPGELIPLLKAKQDN